MKLDAEIERTLDAADADYADETLAVINEHLRELYAMKRERLRGELESKDAVTICTTEYEELLRNKVDSEPQLNITDWRDLRVGDIIECIGESWSDELINRLATVKMIDTSDEELGILAYYKNACNWGCEFKFISRPSADK